MRLQTQVAPEIQKRLLLSRVEAESLKERDILCPTCGFRIQRVFSDATGHLSVKCQKCKNVHILNLAYFRRIRRNGYGSIRSFPLLGKGLLCFITYGSAR